MSIYTDVMKVKKKSGGREGIFFVGRVFEGIMAQMNKGS